MTMSILSFVLSPECYVRERCGNELCTVWWLIIYNQKNDIDVWDIRMKAMCSQRASRYLQIMFLNRRFYSGIKEDSKRPPEAWGN